MSGKFGWEKANRRDAAKRASGPRRQKSRKPKKRLGVQERRPALFYRHQCPECQSLQVATVKPYRGPTSYRCDNCQWSSSIEPNSVLCKWTGKHTFQPLMAKRSRSTPTAEAKAQQQVGSQRMRSAPVSITVPLLEPLDNGLIMGESHVLATDRTTT